MSLYCALSRLCAQMYAHSDWNCRMVSYPQDILNEPLVNWIPLISDSSKSFKLLSGYFFRQEYQVLHEKYMTLKKSYSEQEMVSVQISLFSC